MFCFNLTCFRAQFMVSQKLSEQEVIEKCETLNFPVSVIEYFQGLLGQPPFGFLEPMTTKILKSRNLERVTGRPGVSYLQQNSYFLKGAELEPLDLDFLQYDLDHRLGTTVSGREITELDALSAALYPKVFEEFWNFTSEYGGLSLSRLIAM